MNFEEIKNRFYTNGVNEADTAWLIEEIIRLSTCGTCGGSGLVVVEPGLYSQCLDCNT